MANNQRNEVEITLADKKYKLRPTFEAVAEIEDYFDMGMYELISTKLERGKIKIKGLREIIIQGIKGAEGKVDIDEINEAIIKAGTGPTTTQLIPFIVESFSGTTQPEKKG